MLTMTLGTDLEYLTCSGGLLLKQQDSTNKSKIYSAEKIVLNLILLKMKRSLKIHEFSAMIYL